MLLIGITIFEHEHLVFSGSIFKELDLTMFRYKEEDVKQLMKMLTPESVY